MTGLPLLDYHPPAEPAREVKRRTSGKPSMGSVIDDLLCSTPPRWWSLSELDTELHARGLEVLHTSISARVRDLRRSPYNRHVRTRTRAGTAHVVEYAVGVVVP